MTGKQFSHVVLHIHCLPVLHLGKNLAGKKTKFYACGATHALLATMSMALKGRGETALFRGSILSYNERVIGLTVPCLS